MFRRDLVISICKPFSGREGADGLIGGLWAGWKDAQVL